MLRRVLARVVETCVRRAGRAPRAVERGRAPAKDAASALRPQLRCEGRAVRRARHGRSRAGVAPGGGRRCRGNGRRPRRR